MQNPEITKALARTNDIAKARKLALVAIDRAAREASSLEALRAAIERAIVDVATRETEDLRG
jgi:hypothetical protein